MKLWIGILTRTEEEEKKDAFRFSVLRTAQTSSMRLIHLDYFMTEDVAMQDFPRLLVFLFMFLFKDQVGQMESKVGQCISASLISHIWANRPLMFASIMFTSPAVKSLTHPGAHVER